MAGGEVQEGDSWGVEVDVETVLKNQISMCLLLRDEVVVSLPRLCEALMPY